MKRTASRYGVGGLVPRPPSSPSGKFLNAYGQWTTPSSGGTLDHNALTSNLAWATSGHTGTASRLAGFSGAGAAAYYQLGVDVMAYDAGLANLASVDTGAGLPRLTAAGTWELDALGDLAVSGASWQVTQARGLKSATTTVDVSAATAPTAGQVLTATSSTAATWQTPTAPPDWALYPGVHNGGFRVLSVSVGTLRGSTNGYAYYGGRKLNGLKAASVADGQLIAGVVTNSGTDAFMHTLSGSRWTIVSIFRTPSSFAKVNNAWIGLGNANLGDIDPTGAVPNYTAACHVEEITGDVTLVAEDTGATQTASVGTLSVSTIYALKQWWDGTTLRAALAEVDATTGEIGAYGTAAELTSGIPSISGTTGGMYYQHGWVQGNTAGAAVEMHVGDVECWFSVL